MDRPETGSVTPDSGIRRFEMGTRSLMDMLNEMSGELRADAQAAAAREDLRTVRWLEALQQVVETKYIPVACPAALLIAGQAALAAYDGQSELTWYARTCEEADGPKGQRQLDEAVGILRRAGLWPWKGGEATGTAGRLLDGRPDAAG